jgi:hypothetical protein
MDSLFPRAEVAQSTDSRPTIPHIKVFHYFLDAEDFGTFKRG